MRITLQVLSSPESGTAGLHALRFAQTVGSSEHELGCVFFQDQGVLTGLAGCEPPQAEQDLPSWPRTRKRRFCFAPPRPLATG